MRAVLNPNVLIAALLSRTGAPAGIVTQWLAGSFELIVSDALLDELQRVLAYPKLRAHISLEEAAAFVTLLRASAVAAPDDPPPRRRSPDPSDDYLLELAESQGAVLVSGDQHLLDLADRFPIHTPRQFLDILVAL